MSDPGRIVVVSAGFALWTAGRCVAAARWSDLSRLRAYRGTAGAPGATCLGVDLTDGTVLELLHEAPGFAPFLARAAQVLPGLPAAAAWQAELDAAPEPAVGIVLFERPPTRRSTGR